MSNRSHPTRVPCRHPAVVCRTRQLHPRPWPALTGQAQVQLAQQIARLLPRLCTSQEAHHAERAR
jgi:hypothetical protein